MSETTIDSLDIRLTASATQAVKSINLLEGALAGLGSTVIPVAMGLDKVADSLDRMIANKTGIESLSKSLGALAKSWTTLNSTTTKSSSQMGEAATKAKTMSDTLAKEWGIKGKENVAALRDELTKFYSSLGNEAALGKYINGIDHIIRETARLKKEVDDTASKVREFVSNTTIYVPEQVKSEWGDEFKRKIGILGIRNTTTDRSKGVDPETLIRDINEKFNPDAILGADNDTGLINLRDAAGDAASALDLVIRYLENARQESLTFKEAANESSEPVERLETTLEELAVSMGTTLSGATQSYIEAMSRGQEITQNLSDSIASVNSNLENTETVVSPISNLLESLSALQGVDLPESLKNLEYVANSVGRLGGKYSSAAAENITNIGTALQGLHVEIPEYGDKLQNLAAGLSKLGGKKISDAFEILTRIQVAINNFQHVTIDPAVIDSIQRLGDGLYKFGLAKMDKAVTNIPALAQSLTQLISSLSTVPQVSENTIRLVTALGNLNVNGNQLNRALNNVNGGLRRYKGHALNARKASMSLASAFGKMYANFFIFFRLAQRFKKDIDLASQLTEVQNVVDVTFTDMADKMNEFSKAAVDTLGMSELTAKQIGSKYQAMGKAMGISSDMAKSTNDFVQKATGGYADVAESMADISINLTRLAGDMASFYNMDYAEVAEKLQAIFTGQTRPMRAFGVDLTQASLKAFALANGLNADIKSMTQAEKTLLRYQYVMAQTTAAQGDFIRTQDTWANQTRIATEKLNQLRIVLGKIAIYTFKPLVQSFNKAMEQIIKGAEGLLNALGKIFGWQVEWSEAGVLQDEEEDSEGLADNMGDAADNAKKFKNFLLGIDELNLLPDNSDKDKGVGSGLGDLSGTLEDIGGFNIKPIEKQFDSLYNTLFKLGKKINEVLKDLLQGIDWDELYKKARRFGTGLGEFINGLLYDSETFYEIGKFLAGGVNLLANAVDAYHQQFNGFQWGVDIGNVINGFTENLDWRVIKSAAEGLAHDVAQTINGVLVTTKWDFVGSTLAEGLNTAFTYLYTLGSEIDWGKVGDALAGAINGFFDTFDFGRVAETINAWALGITTALGKALTKVKWNNIGKKLGELIKKIDISKIAAALSDVFIKVLGAAVEVFTSAFAVAPLETGLIAAFGLIKSNKLTPILSALFGDAFGKALGNAGFLSKFSSDIKLIGTQLALGIGAAFTEFTVASSTFKDLYKGVEDVSGAIAKIGTTTVATGGIMTAVFGFPAGTVAAGVIGLIGAFDGYTDGIIEAGKEAEKFWIANTIKVPDGQSITDYFSGASKSMRDMYDSYDILETRIQQTDLSGMRKSVEDDMKNIGIAISSLNTYMDADIDKLDDQILEIEGLFDGFKEHITTLFDEEISTVLEAGTSGAAVNAAQVAATMEGIEYEAVKLAGEAQERIKDLKERYNSGAISIEVFEKELERAYADIQKLNTAEIAKQEDLLSSASQSIDFSKFLLGDEDINSITAKMEEYRVTYQGVIADINSINDELFETYLSSGKYAENLGMDESAGNMAKYIIEQRNKQAEDIEAANTEFIDTLRSVEQQAWEQIGKIIKEGQEEGLTTTEISQRVYEYVNGTFTDIEDAIVKQASAAGITWNSEVNDMVEGMVTDLDNVVMSGMYNHQIPDLFQWWTENQIKRLGQIKPAIGELGQEQSEAAKNALEFADSQNAVSQSLDKAKSSAENGGKSMNGTLQAMTDVKDKSKLAMSGVIDFSTAVDDVPKKGEGVKSLTSTFDALRSMLGNFGTAFIPVETGMTEFAAKTQVNMTNVSKQVNDGFASIVRYGNQTIIWLKNSFAPYFSAAYWNNVTASIPNAFANAFKQAITVMQNLWKQFATWANMNMKINANVTKGSSGVKVQANIPQYSTGGFPEDGFFFANHSEMVGTFSNGKSAVANNEQIVEGIKQGVYEAVSAAMQGGSQGVTVELVGDASDIFTAVVKENNRTIMRTGTSPIRN